MMTKRVKIGWNISHMEFTIEDHYYFSGLKKEITKRGATVRENRSLGDMFRYDVVVINYPEKPFTKAQGRIIERYLANGGKVIVCGYYNNEDNVADNVNTLASRFGLRLNGDKVKDRNHNYKGDELLVVTGRVEEYDRSIGKVLFPCAASISDIGGGSHPLVLREKPSPRSGKETVLGAEVGVKEGRFILLGTCVFWDNFSIKKFSNSNFSLNLLLD